MKTSDLLFEAALPLLRQGYRMAHTAHTKRGPKWIELECGHEFELSHLILVYGHDYPGAYAGKSVPWLPSRCDLIEPGWYVVGHRNTGGFFARAQRSAAQRAARARLARLEDEKLHGAEP